MAAEFRRLTEQDLRRRKSDALTVAIDALRGVAEGDKVAVDRAGAQAFLVALTDTRLLLAERLGLHTEEDVEALHARLTDDAADAAAYAAAVYEFLTWLQESLVGALMGRRLLP